MGIRRLGAALALLPVLIAATAVACTPAKPVESGLVVDGLPVSVHYTASATARPLVLALHGLGSTGEQLEKDTGLDTFADAHDFVVAYPDAHLAPPVPSTPSPSPSPSGTPNPSASPSATPTHIPAGPLAQKRAQLAGTFVEGASARDTTSTFRAWNAGDCCGASNADDVTYLRHVVTAVARQTKIDLRRVYVIGLSNGGMMALRAICDAPTVFAAAGSVAGPYLGTTCARPVWKHLHGALDPVVPYLGGVSPGSTFLSVTPDWCLCTFPDSTTEPARFSPATVSVTIVANGVHDWPKLHDGAWDLDGNAALWSFVSHYHH
jgi:poly(3-hydroxybutyrate) depolymerase